MKKSIKRYIIKTIAIVSSFFYPLRIGRKISNILDRIATNRYKFGFYGDVVLRRPFYLLGENHMHIQSLFSQPGLRMECIRSWQGDLFTPVLKIGENVTFNFRCHIGCINSITIGNNVLIGSNVLITDHAHGDCNLETLKQNPSSRKLTSKGPVVIEDDVWIGENACILPNVTIGKGSVIGCNTVVNCDVPPYSIAVGAPCKIIPSKQVQQL